MAYKYQIRTGFTREGGALTALRCQGLTAGSERVFALTTSSPAEAIDRGGRRRHGRVTQRLRSLARSAILEANARLPPPSAVGPVSRPLPPQRPALLCLRIPHSARKPIWPGSAGIARGTI